MPTFEVDTAGQHIDLDLCLLSGQVFRWEKVESGVWQGVDGDAWFRVKLGDQHLVVDSNKDAATIATFLRLDVDQRVIDQRIIDLGPELKPYVERLNGLRLLRPSSPHEVLFSFLCSANNHLTRITAMVRNLAKRGSMFNDATEPWQVQFPSTEVIASIEEADLRRCGFGYRARSIPEVAREMLRRGDDWLTRLHSRSGCSYEQAHAKLSELPSVGPKLADCICLLGLEHLSAAPLDTHLWQATTRLYYPEWRGKAITAQRYRTAGDHLRQRFGPLTGIAHQYLFYDNLIRYRNKGNPDEANS